MWPNCLETDHAICCKVRACTQLTEDPEHHVHSITYTHTPAYIHIHTYIHTYIYTHTLHTYMYIHLNYTYISKIWDFRFQQRWVRRRFYSEFWRLVNSLLDATIKEKHTNPIFSPWRKCISPKYWNLPTSKHDAITQKNISISNITPFLPLSNATFPIKSTYERKQTK
jgi:hypothetical protein